MATENETATLKPEDCELGSAVWDTRRDVPGIVMGHLGGKVQLRAVAGGREWDATKLRPLTGREELSLHLAARNDASRSGL
jgi:hypothetical protein